MKKFIKIISIISICLIISILIIPAQFSLPVDKMSKQDYNQKSFWAPWGDHMHAGVDIFGKIGTDIFSASNGIVILSGTNNLGGKFITVLDADFRFHYYAHLSSIDTYIGCIVLAGDKIGTLGNTGSAINTPPHLHYGIYSLIPNTYDISISLHEDSFKPFCINPIPMLNSEF